MSLARKVMIGVASGVTSKMVRTATRKMMHTGSPTPRLPARVQRKTGFGTALMWAAGAGAFLAISDVLKEQRKITAARTV